MNLQSLLPKIAAAAACLSLLTASLFAQAPKASPREERLLNGLKLLMFSDPAADQVSMVVRVHAGSAFDPQGKEGVMKLLAANIFPNPEIKEYFRDELGGSLDIEDNYDFIEVRASAKSDKLLTMMEAVSTAVANVPVEKETTDKLKTAQLKIVSDLSKDPSYVADQAAAARLFGTFPYGRPVDGTPSSIQKIEYADLLFAKQRFFTSDNATVVVAGKFDTDLAYRAARRFLGSWLKSDKLVPQTFRQPDDPLTALQLVNSPIADAFSVRIATRGASRGAADSAACSIAAGVIESRLKALVPGQADAIAVACETHVLPGMFMISFSGMKQDSAPKIEAADLITKAFGQSLNQSEFQAAKHAYLTDRAKEPITDRWLDVDTYKIAPPSKPDADVSAADVQRMLDKLQKQPFARVMVSSKSAN